MIKSFLFEFSTKYVTGAMLMQLKKDEDMIDKLMEKFSEKNQAFGIWMVVKNAIMNIGDSAQTVGE